MFDFKGKKTLIPRKKINTGGSINYNESMQAWNIIKIKKNYLVNFLSLKKKGLKFSYQLMFCRTHDEFLKITKKLKKKKLCLC